MVQLCPSRGIGLMPLTRDLPFWLSDMFRPNELCWLIPNVPKLFFFFFKWAIKSKLGSAFAIKRLLCILIDVGDSKVTSFWGFLDSSGGSFIFGGGGCVMLFFITVRSCLGDFSPSRLVFYFLNIGETDPIDIILVGDWLEPPSSCFSSKRQIHIFFSMSKI